MRKVYALAVCVLFLLPGLSWGQTLFDDFGDGNFTTTPTWGGTTTSWTIVANSDVSTGAVGSNTLRLNAAAVSTTDYLSSQIATWGTSQEWNFWIGRRSTNFTAANQAYFWLYANEATLNSATVDGYRLAIGDDSGNDEIRLEYLVNGAVSSTVITSSGAITNSLTDYGILVRVTRSSTGVWALYTSTIPTSNGSGPVATAIPNAANTPVSQGTGTNNTLVPAANGYLGVGCLHSTGAAALISTEFDQIHFTASTATPCTTPSAAPGAITIPVGSTTASSIDGSFVAASPAPTNYLVVRSPNSTLAPTDLPADGTTYAAGDAIGATTVVDVDANTSFSATGLADGTLYYFYIFSFNGGTCSGGPLYKTDAYSTASKTTRPNLVTSLKVTCQTTTSATVTWTNPEANYDGIIILARNSALSPNLPEATMLPAAITGNANFTSGTMVSAAAPATYAVYKGTGTSVVVTGLTAGQPYTFMAVAYKTDTYSSTTAPTTAIASLRVPDVSSLIANAGNNMVAVNWANPSAGCFDEVLVVANAGAVAFVPAGDGSAYTANAVYTGPNQVVYKGTGFNVDVTGLTNGTNYCFKAFVRQGTNWSTGVSICATANNVSALSPGDMAIIGFDAQIGSGSADKIYITNLVSLNAGTKFLLVNSRFEAGAPANTRTNKWYGAGDPTFEDPGVVQFEWQGPGALAAGSIITFELNGTIISNISINNASAPALVATSLSSTVNISTSEGDQLYLAQGAFTPFGTTGVDRYNTFDGRVLFGITTGINWIPFNTAVSAALTGGTTRQSRKPADIECLGVYFPSRDGYYYRNSSLHLGTKSQLLTQIINTTNYGGNTTTIPEDFATNTANAIGTAFTVNPGLTDGTWVGGTSTEWFNCQNWNGLAVPDAATDVTIPTATNNPLISRLSTNANRYIVNGVINAKSKDLTLSGGTLGFNTGVVDTLEVFSNAILTSGTLNMSSGGLVRLNGSWTKTGATFTSGLGTIEYKGIVTQTIAPENYYNLKSSSTGDRVMSSTGTVGIAGAFTKGGNTYTFTNSTVEYNGPTTQNIADFTSTATTPGETYNNLTLSGSNTKILTGNTDVEGDFTINNNITFTLGVNNLRIRSLATKTGRVAAITGTPTINYSSTGRFVIERYFPAKRSWRMITAPVTVDGTKTIFNSWQQGGGAPFTGAIGSGTYVTGPGPDPLVNGFDDSQLDNYSLKTFNQSTSAWDGVPNTRTGITAPISGSTGAAGVPDNKGFFMFVRGDRSASNSQAFNPYGTVVETTLRDTGKIQIHSYTFPCNTNVSPDPNRYTSIGNPYASPVDFDNLTRVGVANKFWAWDPNLNEVGAYVLVDRVAGNITVPMEYQPYTGTINQTKEIQSKQAIIVESTTGATHTVTFNETAKSTVDIPNLFRPVTNNLPFGAFNLLTQDQKGKYHLLDGAVAQYGKEFSNDFDYMDAARFINVNETFGILEKGTNYMLHRRQPLTENDTIFFSLKKLTQKKYKFNFILENFSGENLTGYLEDAYLKTSQPIQMDGSSWIDFEVNSNAASANASRFRIVFKKTVQGCGIEATVARGDANVNWWYNSELDMHHYEVERSVDGQNFETIGNSSALNSGSKASYLHVDEKPAPGVYYYRIKAVNNYSSYGYSETVKVQIVRDSDHFFVFPNPVTDNNINLQLNNADKGIYKVKLVNAAGQLIMQKQIVHPGGSVTHTIKADQYLAAGTYQLEVATAGKKPTVIGVVVKHK